MGLRKVFFLLKIKVLNNSLLQYLWLNRSLMGSLTGLVEEVVHEQCGGGGSSECGVTKVPNLSTDGQSVPLPWNL